VKVEVRATADEVTLTIGVRHGFYAELRALARAQGTEPAQLVAQAIGQLVPRSAPIEAGSGMRS
jgi:hypothetical protein